MSTKYPAMWISKKKDSPQPGQRGNVWVDGEFNFVFQLQGSPMKWFAQSDDFVILEADSFMKQLLVARCGEHAI